MNYGKSADVNGFTERIADPAYVPVIQHDSCVDPIHNSWPTGLWQQTPPAQRGDGWKRSAVSTVSGRNMVEATKVALNNTPFGVVVVSDDYRVIFLNSMAQELVDHGCGLTIRSGVLT